MAAGGSHVIIVGGVSVNDPGGHDAYPYNFINPAVVRARDYKTRVTIIVFAPPYRKRVTDQKIEHSQVAYSWAYECHLPFVSVGSCPEMFKSKTKNPDHFLNVLRTSAAKHKAALVILERGEDLAAEINKLAPIDTVDYFGHANKRAMFLQYSTSGVAAAEVSWSDVEAAAVTAGAVTGGFTSFGCNQGESGGMADKISALWGVRSVGSDGRTDYKTIGQGLAIPSSAGGYYAFPPGGGARTRLSTSP